MSENLCDIIFIDKQLASGPVLNEYYLIHIKPSFSSYISLNFIQVKSNV